MTCRIIVWVRDGALRPTAVDRPWASCTFQTGNSCSSSFLSGRFLQKIMLQKARRGKRNKPRCCWPAIFASILFSENEKGQRLHGRRRAIVDQHATVLITNNEPCQNLTRAGWNVNWVSFEQWLFRLIAESRKRYLTKEGLARLTAPGKNEQALSAAIGSITKKIPCILRFPQRLKLSSLWLSYLSQQYT